MEDWADGAGTDNGASALVEASKRAVRRWHARLTLAVWKATAARATGPDVRVGRRQKSGDLQERGCPFPGMGVFAPPSPSFQNVWCVRGTEILVEIVRRSCNPRAKQAIYPVTGSQFAPTVGHTQEPRTCGG